MYATMSALLAHHALRNAPPQPATSLCCTSTLLSAVLSRIAMSRVPSLLPFVGNDDAAGEPWLLLQRGGWNAAGRPLWID